MKRIKDKKVWVVKSPESDRPMITPLNFGLYTTFPSKEAAEAFTQSPLCSKPAEIVEGLLITSFQDDEPLEPTAGEKCEVRPTCSYPNCYRFTEKKGIGETNYRTRCNGHRGKEFVCHSKAPKLPERLSLDDFERRFEAIQTKINETIDYLKAQKNYERLR